MLTHQLPLSCWQAAMELDDDASVTRTTNPQRVLGCAAMRRRYLAAHGMPVLTLPASSLIDGDAAPAPHVLWLLRTGARFAPR